MRKIETVCARDCYDACSLLIALDDAGRILSIKGNPRNPVTQDFTCPRGAKDHERLFKNRVKTPAIRKKERFEEKSWEECLDLVSKKLSSTIEEHGHKAVLHLTYDGNAGLLTSLFPQRLWNAIGATQTDRALCSGSGHRALELHYGSSHGIVPEEILSRRLLVFWGFNAVVSSPHLWSLARKARSLKGCRIIVVDPVKSESARQADLWIRPRPGSDVALAYGLMKHLIDSGHADMGFLREWTCGFEELKEEASKWTPEVVEEISGVSGETVAELGEAYGNLSPSATMIGIGLQKCMQGAEQVRAVSLVPALLGLHRGFFYSNANAYFINDDFISGRALTDKSIGIVSQVALAPLVGKGDFKFIYVSGMNPAVTLPDANAFRKGLEREDVFVVVSETHWTKTAQRADVVLPAPAYLEKEDMVIPWSHNHVSYSRKVVNPQKDCRDEIWVMRELARRLGLKETWLYQDPWEALGFALKEAFIEGGIESLRSGAPLELKRKPLQSYPTPSQKIEFYASRAPGMNLEPLPTQSPVHGGDGKFLLLTSSTPLYTNTQFQEVYGSIPSVVHLNPRDAERLGIKEADAIILSNELGKSEMRARISDKVPCGVLWSPRQNEGLDGEPQNCLTKSEPQKIGGGPIFNSTAVTLDKSIRI